MSWFRRLLALFVGALAVRVVSLQRRLGQPDGPAVPEAPPQAALPVASVLEPEGPTSRLGRIGAAAGTVFSKAAGLLPRFGSGAPDAGPSPAAPVPAAPAVAVAPVLVAKPHVTAVRSNRIANAWGEVSLNGDLDDVVHGVCRRKALSAAAKTMPGTSLPFQVLCFEVAHEVALLNGRTTLLDFDSKDILRACQETIEDFERYGVAEVSADKLVGALSAISDIQRVSELHYFSKVGLTILGLMGGMTFMKVGTLAYHLGSPRLLAPQRARDAAVVYFIGRMSHRLYAAR